MLKLQAMTVFLIGFMGAGKTTLGKKLAPKLQCTFIDVDHLLEQRENKTIREIIATHGEAFFREKESETLRSIDIENKIISTGGGTPCFHDNMAWMNAHGITLFLNVSEKAIYSRLKTADREQRPLLRGMDDEGLRLFIHDKLRERRPFYEQAQLSLDPISEPLNDVAEGIRQYNRNRL
ncbi:MAG: shikimate kinase [Bacteroidetes bacterium]|nr:shikimate kinase [Bacteroidota bacterium]